MNDKDIKRDAEGLKMPTITKSVPLKEQRISGVTVLPFGGVPITGEPQKVLVSVSANGQIPLHTHSVDAEMLIVFGEGVVLAVDSTNGTVVRAGDRVFFERDMLHGFQAGPDGLGFVSVNGGVVDSVADRWDINFDIRDEPDNTAALQPVNRGHL